MKRFFAMVAIGISLLVLTAACGGESSNDDGSNQGTPQGATTIEPTNAGAANTTAPPVLIINSGEPSIENYLGLMAELHSVLSRFSSRGESGASIESITTVVTQLANYTGFFAAMDEPQRRSMLETHGDEIRQSAEQVASLAVSIQGIAGGEAITQALSTIPAFAAVSATTDRPTNNPEIVLETTGGGAVTVPQGAISTLLFPDEVSALAGGVDLSTNHLDLLSMAAGVDPSQVEHMESFDSLSFETDGRSPSLSLTTIKFDSEEFVAGHMEIVLSEAPGMQNLSEPMGDSAYYIEVNQSGIGSMVVFKSGVWVVMLHTSQGANDSPLVDLAGVESLARIIVDRP